MLKYPVMLIHGFGMPVNNIEHSRYWGGIPDRLRNAGISLWFSTQDALGGVESNGKQVAEAIRVACERTGADKIHAVAHSKGGLDLRSAIASEEGTAEHVASFVSLSSPHNGMHFVDFFARSRIYLPYIVGSVMYVLARIAGDKKPSLKQTLKDLSTEGAKRFAQCFDNIPCVSYGFESPSSKGLRRFDMRRRLVNHFDGKNDGFVPLWSTEFGRWIAVHVEGVRNFVHVDTIDRRHHNPRLILPNGRVFPSIADLIIDTLETIECEEMPSG